MMEDSKLRHEPDPNKELRWTWKIVGNSRYKGSYQWAEEPEMIHIIRTGFHDRYLIVWEDVYELMLGKTEVLTKKEIKDKFNIDIE